MKVIILASGIGKRLRPLTNDKPKSLVKITKKTILEHQLDNLAKYDIKKVIITTGPFEDKVKNHLAEKYNDFKISYVHNPEYDATNYIYSLWLTKDLIDDDIILFHGDLLFDEKLLKKILDGNGNFVLVNKKAKLPEKDFKALIKNNKVLKIGVNLFCENAFFSLPLYKFSKKDFLIWINEMEKEIKDGNLDIYAEDAFNNISDEITLHPLYFSKEFCMEIDTKEDLEIARNLLMGDENG
jgi:phosphoenolpyruvate phosphomutase